MTTKHNPSSIVAPFGAYSHGAETPPNARWLHTAGQVGVDASGECPESFEAQAELVWQNLAAILDSAGMGFEDLVKITGYIVGQENFKAYSAVRSRVLCDARPASTAIVVPALALPGWLVEIEAIAAKA